MAPEIILTNQPLAQKNFSFKNKEKKRHNIPLKDNNGINPAPLKIPHLEDLASDAELVKILLKHANIMILLYNPYLQK